ncbi:MAG TPA: ribosome assembly cofactor RimP [Mariprofundaceae bacterium]|nr:ribosome assembly cofactor RimP [Mariprofundaceae bacterium]
MEERIRELLEPIAAELDVDVLKVSLGGGRRSQLLRVIVDRAGGVECGDLERISRALSLQLDAEDLIAGHYRLEISSPGLDWPLITPADFRRHAGERLRAQFVEDDALEGENLGPVDGGVRIADDTGKEHDVLMDDVTKVVRAVQWKKKRAGGKK